MLMPIVKGALARFGLSLHRKASIDRLHRELDRMRRLGGARPVSPDPPPPMEAQADDGGNASHHPDYDAVLASLDWYEQRRSQFLTTEDYDARGKQIRLIDGIKEIGRSDFADLACWLFASSLINHRILHQRIDEGALLWRAVKNSGGPILEIGRAAGGSTTIILGASGDRKVVSIDRAPSHAEMADRIFERPDVRDRLTLYMQSSREPIAENAFGMSFIDGDHSYEGVCHDIASFWNMLKPMDGKPAIAVFHDAVENPIAYVAPVKRACDELIAEPGVAKVVGAWGSMLALEKLGDIDQDRWYAKESRNFWKRYASSAYPVLAPKVLRGRLGSAEASAPIVTKVLPNLIGEENVDDPSWIKTGVTIEGVYSEADNPVRFVRDVSGDGAHGIKKNLKRKLSEFRLIAFVRPIRTRVVRFTVLDAGGVSLADVDFELTNNSRVLPPRTNEGVNVKVAAFLYGNGFFRCEIIVSLAGLLTANAIAISAPAETSDAKEAERGFLMNLASVRELA